MYKSYGHASATTQNPDALAEGIPSPELPRLASRNQMQSGLLGRLFRQQSLRWFALLGAIELVLLMLSPWLAMRSRFHAEPAMLNEALVMPAINILLFTGIVWTSMMALGMYQRHGRGDKSAMHGTLARLILALSGGGLALMVLNYLLPGVEFALGILALSLGWAFVFMIMSRLIFFGLANGTHLKRRALFLGAGTKAAAILQEEQLEKNLHSARIVGFADIHSDTDDATLPFDPSRRLIINGSLVDTAFHQRIDDIVLASDDMRNGVSMEELVACRLAGITVLRLGSFYEREMGRVLLEGLLPSWFVFTSNFNGSVLRRLSRRSFDLAAAAAILFLAWPAMILVAIAIWLESGGRGPVLYFQRRVGEGDKGFALVKFRSMRTDAELDGVARWAKADDTRVTRVGRLIRKLRLDELPQLYNVLRGDMSMVGPRPERPEIVDILQRQIPYYGLRHSIRPGLTGWAQLRYPYGASVADSVEKLRYDLYYIKNQSPLFDFQILLQTVEVVLFRRGSR